VLSFLELDGEWPYLWLDATYIKVRQNGRIVSIAAIIATGVNQDGRREILGLGQSEAATFWIEFLRGLVRRGLKGVKLVISDAHEGLKAAITQVLSATWQRCRVHFMRSLLAHVPKSQQCRPLSGRSSSSPIARPPDKPGAASPISSAHAFARSPLCSTMPNMTCSPTWTIPRPIAVNYTRQAHRGTGGRAPDGPNRALEQGS
jgi:hypothetical protein